MVILMRGRFNAKLPFLPNAHLLRYEITVSRPHIAQIGDAVDSACKRGVCLIDAHINNASHSMHISRQGRNRILETQKSLHK